MKLKTLLIVVTLLAVVSAVVYFVQRPAATVNADARVGQPLLDVSVLERATTIRLTDAGRTVELLRQPDGEWQVVSFHRLPADFGKLSRFVKDLTDAKIERLVTSNPEMLERMQFNNTTLELSDEGGTSLWAIDLGRTAEGGGRFVRFEDETKAYLTRLNAWLDATPRNWVNASLVSIKPEQVAQLEMQFEDGTTLSATRESAEAPFMSDGRRLRQAPVTSLLTTLTSLRFSDTAPAGDEEAAAAKSAARTFRLTTFGGETITVALGRRPAPPPAPAVEGEDAPAPEPPGSVFAFVQGPPEFAPLSAAAEELTFKVADYSYSNLPANAAALEEPAAAVPASAPEPDQTPDSPPAPSPASSVPAPATDAPAPPAATETGNAPTDPSAATPPGAP